MYRDIRISITLQNKDGNVVLKVIEELNSKVDDATVYFRSILSKVETGELMTTNVCLLHNVTIAS